MNWVFGRRGFSFFTASTPLMPGRLMSIKTTFGCFSGSRASALSASPHSPARRKPDARLIQPARILRAWASSSTMETAIAMEVLYSIFKLMGVIFFDDAEGQDSSFKPQASWLEGNGQLHARAFTW